MTGLLLVALLPVFALIGLGYAAGRLAIVDNSRVADLNAFIMQFAVPASLFMAVAQLGRADLLAQGPLAGLLLALMLIVYGLWFFAARHRGVARPEAAVQALTVAFPNLAAVALPILADFDPGGGVAKVAVGLAIGSIGPTACTLILIDIGNQTPREAGAGRILLAARRSMLRPLVVAPVLGALFSLGGIVLPAAVVASLKLLAQASAGGALFLTGLVLSSQRIRVTAATAAAALAMNVERPLLMAGLLRAVPVVPEVAKAALVMAAVPAGFFGILFGISKQVDVEATGSMIVLSYLLALVTLTVVLALVYVG